VALSGEGLFFQMKLRENSSFIESSLSAQSRFFNSPWGLYTEGPMPYDHFPGSGRRICLPMDTGANLPRNWRKC
jgi:hypothetical protein